jgi:hypothetical protein
MCILSPQDVAVPAHAVSTPAQLLPAAVRQQLALDALAGLPVTELAQQHQVSRKFVTRQAEHARQALRQAFAPPVPSDEEVLFVLPVTRAWLRSFMLSLVLVGHSPLRGVQEILRDRFDYPVSLGTVHNVLQQAVAPARAINAQQDLSPIQVAAHDELFQVHQPVLVGMDVASTYCYLLSQEAHRDTDTWAVHLWDLQAQGFAPHSIIADGGQGLRAGQRLALAATPCRADVFHVERDFGHLVRFLENRAYQALTAADKLRRQAQRRSASPTTRTRARTAQEEAARAVALADAVAVLERWLRQDILAVAGPPLEDRRVLFDYVVAELQARVPLSLHRIGPLCRLLENQRDDLLAFVEELDQDIVSLAGYCRVAPARIRAVLTMQALPATSAERWRRESLLRREWGEQWDVVADLVREMAAGVVRASSVIENLNGRLRTYFFLRRHLGADYLELLRFYLNHRRFPRSEHPERVGRSPAELLSGEEQPSWLEQLGYRPFRRSA